MKLRRTNRPRAWPLFFDADWWLNSVQSSGFFTLTTFRSVARRRATTPIPSRARLLKAPVAKIFGLSLLSENTSMPGTIFQIHTASFWSSDSGFVLLRALFNRIFKILCPIAFFVSAERVYVADGRKSKIRRQPALGRFSLLKEWTNWTWDETEQEFSPG